MRIHIKKHSMEKRKVIWFCSKSFEAFHFEGD